MASPFKNKSNALDVAGLASQVNKTKTQVFQKKNTVTPMTTTAGANFNAGGGLSLYNERRQSNMLTSKNTLISFSKGKAPTSSGLPQNNNNNDYMESSSPKAVSHMMHHNVL